MQDTVTVKALPPIDKLTQGCETKHSVVAAVAGHADAVLEPKFDGWHLVTRVEETGEYDDEGDAILRTRVYVPRAGKEYTGNLPAIEAALAANLPAGTVLDGEIVAFSVENGNVVHKRGVVQSVMGSSTAKAALNSGALTFMVFDLIAHGDIDARRLTLSQRRTALEAVFANADFPNSIMLVPQLEPTQENHANIIAAGYEGSVVKWDVPYASGKKGSGWFKIKPQTTIEAIITGYKDGTPGSSLDGMVGAVEFSQYDEDGKLRYRGRCSGMDWNVRVAISNDREGHLNRVIEVASFGVDGEPLFDPFISPQFKGFRDDRTPESVTVHDG